MITKINPNINCIPTPLSSDNNNKDLTPNVYFIKSKGRAAFIDSGFRDDPALKDRIHQATQQPNLKVERIILTHHHPDHYGGAKQIQEATGGQISIHTEERPFLKNGNNKPNDLTIQNKTLKPGHNRLDQGIITQFLKNGDYINIGDLSLEIIHTPGHTMGSICVFLKKDGILFTGDSILGNGTTAIMPPPVGNMSLYIQSLRKLQKYTIKMILPGHGPTIHNAQEKIAFLIKHREDREGQILSLIKTNTTIVSILPKIYPALKPHLSQMAYWQIEAHLDKLIKEGQIKRTKTGFSIT